MINKNLKLAKHIKRIIKKSVSFFLLNKNFETLFYYIYNNVVIDTWIEFNITFG